MPKQQFENRYQKLQYEVMGQLVSGTASSTKVLMLVHVFTLGVPYAFYLLFKTVEYLYDVQYLNTEFLQHYYFSSHLLTLNILLNIVVGWVLLRKNLNPMLYELYSSLSFNLHAFYVAFFFGIFVTPGLLVLILMLGFSVIILRPWILILNLLVFFMLFFLTAIAHVKYHFPYLPLLSSLSVYDAEIRTFLVPAVAVYCIILFLLFFYFFNALSQATKDKQRYFTTITEKLSRYTSPQIYEGIVNAKSGEISLESKMKFLTIFVSDIKDFTRITENMESETLEIILNEYLEAMSSIALEYGGTIDKFIGDSVVIFFGDPASFGKQEDAVRCVNMALEMQEKLVEMNTKWLALGLIEPLKIRIGINSGDCIVGNYGSDTLLNYSVIGKNVGIASLLEQQCPPNHILISQRSMELVEGAFDAEQNPDMAFPSFFVKKSTAVSDDAGEKYLDKKVEAFLESITWNSLDQQDKHWLSRRISKNIKQQV